MKAMKNSEQKQGFTLIEMLIVVAIIGVLASIVLVGLGPTQRTGRDARRIADLKQVQTALELYFQKNGQYPNSATWAALETDLVSATIGVNKIPNDPNSNRNYTYAPNTSRNGYLLRADLEDGNNPALRTDIDGTQSNYGNTDCGTAASDTIYCIIF